MPYYNRNEEEVDDFKDNDPTPFGGGYDIVFVYGRPIPPSNQTCYPLSSPSDEYKRPDFAFYHEQSAYAGDALRTDSSSYTRPGPVYGFQPTGKTDSDKSEFGTGLGHRPAYETPSSGHDRSGYGSKPEYEGSGIKYGGTRHESEYEFGYGRKPETESGSRFGGRTKSQTESGDGERTATIDGSGYGGRTEPGYGYRGSTESQYGSGYGGRTKSEYGSGHGGSVESDRRKKHGGKKHGGSVESDRRKKHGGKKHGGKKHGGDDDDEESKSSSNSSESSSSG